MKSPQDAELPAVSGNAHFDRDKARAAARNKRRPGEQCRAPAGQFVPQVNRNRCEGKSDCAQVCPYDVFEVRRIDDADWRALSVLAKLKVFAHRKQSAYAVRAD